MRTVKPATFAAALAISIAVSVLITAASFEQLGPTKVVTKTISSTASQHTETLTSTATEYDCVEQVNGLSLVTFDNGSQGAIPQPSCMPKTDHTILP
jgi:hypothetical protein